MVVIERNDFIEEAIKILTSLGYSTEGYSEEEIEMIMKNLGYKQGYKGKWIMPGDIILDEEYI